MCSSASKGCANPPRSCHASSFPAIAAKDPSNLQSVQKVGQFFDRDASAAVATNTVIPMLIVYLALQRHFVAGLTLGASKG